MSTTPATTITHNALRDHVSVFGGIFRTNLGAANTVASINGGEMIERVDLATVISQHHAHVERRQAGRSRAAALREACITPITTAELDSLLAPYISFGMLRTTYNAGNCATEYRGPSGKLIAVSVGTHHFRNRDKVTMAAVARLLGMNARSDKPATVLPFPGASL